MYKKKTGEKISSQTRSKFSIMLIIASLVMFLTSTRMSEYNIQILSIMLLYLGIVISLSKKDVLIFLFISSFLIFLVTRSFIDMIDGYPWYARWDVEYISSALTILYLSLFMLNVGVNVSRNVTLDRLDKKIKIQSSIKETTSLNKNTKTTFITIIVLLYLFTYLFHLYVEMDKFTFMQGKLYEEYYLSYNPNFNILVKLLAGLTPYLFLLILSLKPKINTAYILFFLHVGSTIPTLLIGQRGSFMLASVLMVVYFLIQNTANPSEKWLNKYNIGLVLIMIPIVILLMSYVNEGRHGSKFEFSGIFSTMKMFVHKQGVTFDAFMHGVQAEARIRSLTGATNYVFGEIFDFLKYNPVSKIIFDTKPLPSGNNVVKALNSGSYAHILSYVTHHSYLKGFGFGTTYVLEVFHTYGMVGLVLFNIGIGILLDKLRLIYKQGILSRFIALTIISKILYIPRQSFSSMLMFIVHPYFWLTILLFVTLNFILSKFDRDFLKNKIINIMFN